MKYVLIGIAMVAFMVVALAGFRGDISRKPPLEVIPDMDRQPKLRPMEPNAFFKNGLSSQPLVKGTVARSEPLVTTSGKKVYPFQTDHAVNKGYTIEDGATNYVSIPLPVTMEFVERGRERFRISCVPCHGAQGDGNGIVGKFGFSGIRDLRDAAPLSFLLLHGHGGGFGAHYSVPSSFASAVSGAFSGIKNRAGTLSFFASPKRLSCSART